MATRLATHLASTEWEVVDLRTVMSDVQFDGACYYFFESQTVKVKIPRLSLSQYVEIQNLGSGWAGYEKPKFFLRTEMKTEGCEETRNFSK